MSMAIVDKRRQKANSCEVMNVIGDVRDKDCILFDDMVDTIPAIDPKKSSKIKYLQVAPMFAEAIERIYQEISISKLFR